MLPLKFSLHRHNQSRSRYVLAYLPSGHGLWKYLKVYFLTLSKDHN